MITKINIKEMTIKSYAIRKLTPKECFRLMGVREKVISIMQQTKTRIKKIKDKVTGNHVEFGVEEPIVSASQQYKQAGNSIVVDVLKAIYNQLWYPPDIDVPARGQVSIFDVIETSENGLQKHPVDLSVGCKHIITTFSGYDSQLMAADALKEDHPEFTWTCDGWSDIDKYACQMHDLVFPQFADKALGDITKIDWHKVKESMNGHDVDLFTYSSPCQDISQAGKQMGLKEGSGSRSALLWNVADAIEVLRPKYLLQENVAALVSQKFMPDFKLWLDRLDSLGYVSKWARLNAKNYGVPQNRDRVFCLSMRNDVAFDYQFPPEVPLTKTLESILEDDVDTKYFLKDESVDKFLRANDEDDESDVLFFQFPIPPKHEDAMFLKTWLSRWMDSNCGWDMSRVVLAKSLEEHRDEFLECHKSWAESGEFADEEFMAEYENNMSRKADVQSNASAN